MTSAAKELHMTQSGVSQHIKALEDMLNVRLFDRIKQRLVPTAAAGILYRQCSKSLNEIESALVEIKGGDRELSGVVSLGMPVEFGHNVILPRISAFSVKHPKVKFKFVLGLAGELADRILSGELDFAFVDDIKMDARIKTEGVFDEILELCVGTEYLKKAGPVKNTKAYFETLDYIEYQEGEPILRMWFSHHLSTRSLELQVRAFVTDTKGVGKLIAANLGAGVLPGHLASKLELEGTKLHRFKGSGSPLKNRISLALLEGKTHSPTVQAVLSEINGIVRGKMPAL
jgi:DNA-binding transcriptional LysR family regulator